MQTGEFPLDVRALDMIFGEDARAGKAMRRIIEIYTLLFSGQQCASRINGANPLAPTERKKWTTGATDGPDWLEHQWPCQSIQDAIDTLGSKLVAGAPFEIMQQKITEVGGLINSVQDSHERSALINLCNNVLKRPQL
jgi:hypothetical protein